MPPQKVVVTCAVTGSVHVPSLSPHLPVTPDEIATNAIDAANAGAAIVHLHARDPETGRPTADADVFAQFLPTIREASDVVINLTTGGSAFMSIDDRIAAARRFKPELCSLNMGSMNFGLYPMIPAVKEFKHEWEQPFLEGSRSWIFRNTFEDIETIVGEMSTYGTRFEFECYDVGHIYTLAHFLERGLVQPPLFVQTIFGILGGIGTDAEDFLHMKRTADRLLGDACVWSVLGAGRHQTRLVTMGAMLGANVRVGLEDSLYLERGQLAGSNAEQVAKIVRILGELSLEIATPDEARALLHLKGAAATSI
ncbi:MAG: hypothetical protein QOD65_3413 [Gaiellales bacterium]|jgi:uncharacterized protein (DUF849 family)|nr:hypothetical protein [Gaiellales bacterium]